MTGRNPDTLYTDLPAEPGSFAFDEAVTAVFEDMINRSVPGYQTMLGMLGVFARKFVTPGSQVYDLGCSLGASTIMLRQHIEAADCRIVAVDNAPAMIEKCRINLEKQTEAAPVELRLGQVEDIEIRDASLVVMNLILQFIPLQARHQLLQSVHRGMLPGGGLLLMEKIRFNDSDEQQFFDDTHLDFKRTNGYSELEISRKRAALEDFLVTETLDEHISRLRQCSFKKVYPWFSCLNFVGLIAIK